jgi:SAM-dependent methyltransferase
VANEFRTLDSHSAEYFGDTRDYWWNADFLALMGRRLALDRVRDMLDVGCGVGHWGQLLAGLVASDARIEGIDRDPLWVDKATARAAARRIGARCKYRVGVAEALPFADASFDLVTCQTLLIHARDPAAVVAEMARVARPGGLVLAAEPNNLAGALILDSVSFDDPVDDVLACARLQLICERGKAALGEGNNSIGDLVPGLFARCGLVDIRVHLSDKTNAILPPYDTPEQRAMLDECGDLLRRDFWIWSRADTQRYFVAGGGREGEFDALWSLAMRGGGRFEQAVAAQTYAGSGAAVGYLVAGRKPAYQPASR